eukprot:13896369-Alexandrium_andersonii.AAC.1
MCIRDRYPLWEAADNRAAPEIAGPMQREGGQKPPEGSLPLEDHGADTLVRLNQQASHAAS